jgi:hypothetical protein
MILINSFLLAVFVVTFINLLDNELIINLKAESLFEDIAIKPLLVSASFLMVL